MSDAEAKAAPSSNDRAAEAVLMAARAHERDRYLTALLAPKTVRQDLINLAAFQGEVARIPLFVTEPMIGEIRLQWWRDTISNADAGVLSGNPVADAFTRTMRTHQLSRGLIEGMIDAQTLALYPDPPRDDMALHQALTKTEGAAFELAARIVNGAALSSDDAQVCRDAGLAYGLVRTAVEFAAVTAQGRTLLPADMLADAGLTAGELDQESRADAVARLVAGLVETAEVRVVRVRQSAAWRGSVRVACRPLAMVPAYAAAVRRCGPAIVRQTVDVLPLTRVWRIWRG
jgi:phytoene synthase